MTDSKILKSYNKIEIFEFEITRVKYIWKSLLIYDVIGLFHIYATSNLAEFFNFLRYLA